MQHHIPLLRGIVLVGFIALMGITPARAADATMLDHYVQVDLGTKRYNFEMCGCTGTERQLSGTFDSSIVISPTVRVRPDLSTDNVGVHVLAGMSYGQFRSDITNADTYEWQLGLGCSATLNRFTQVGLLVSGGYGVTFIEGPEYWNGISGGQNDAGMSSHVEAVVGVTFGCEHVMISANVGYRISQLRLHDHESDRVINYSLHGVVLAGGIGFTF